MVFLDSIVLNLPGFTPADKSSNTWWRLKNVSWLFFSQTKVCWRSCSYGHNTPTRTRTRTLHMLKYISFCCVSFPLLKGSSPVMVPTLNTAPIHHSLAKVSCRFFCKAADHNTAVNLNGKLIKASTTGSCTSSSWNVALSPCELPHAEGREGEGKKQVTPTHTLHPSSQLWLSVRVRVREEWLKTTNNEEHPSLRHPLTGTTAADSFRPSALFNGWKVNAGMQTYLDTTHSVNMEKRASLFSQTWKAGNNKTPIPSLLLELYCPLCLQLHKRACENTTRYQDTFALT